MPRSPWRARARARSCDALDCGVDPVALGDEVRRGRRTERRPPPTRPACGRGRRQQSPMPRERVEREHLDVAPRRCRARPSRIAPSRSAASGPPSAASIAASRHSPSAYCSPPPAARCHALADSSAARASSVRPSARSTRPRCTRGERRQAEVAGRLGLLDREVQRLRRRPRGHRPDSAPARDSTPDTPRSAGSRAAVTRSAARPMCTTASSNRCSSRASSPSIASPRACSHGSSTADSHRSTWSRASRTLRSDRPRRSPRATAKSQLAA